MRNEQNFLKTFQRDMNWEIKGESYTETKASLLNNYMLLTTEVSEIAEELRAVFNATYKAKQANLDENEAFEKAKELHKDSIGKEIADCIAYLMKFANYFDIDMEKSFYSKMEEVKNRINKDQRV
jgi:NTP pyrophosphatase (non-canonical NTP hydrolase)